MKALMSENAKKMLADPDGKKQMRKLISSGFGCAQIKLSTGQIFTVKSTRG